MKSRGYGIPDRTAFSIYRFDKRDAFLMLFLIACGAYIVTGSALGGLRFRYFPHFSLTNLLAGETSGIFASSLFFIYFVLCIVPVVINIREDRKWKAM
jgi:energy-coupling factor transport system permease protein